MDSKNPPNRPYNKKPYGKGFQKNGKNQGYRPPSSSDYLTYKKSRMNPTRVQRVEKRVEKVKRILKLSFITFCVMFICVVIFIKKYAKRVDIEYGRHGIETVKEGEVAKLSENYIAETYDPDKRTIDKRLLLIQEEENAPSESRVLPQDRDKNEVMNLEHFEQLKKEDEFEFDEPKKKEETKPSQTEPKAENQSPAQKPENHPPLAVEAQGNFAPIEFTPKTSIKVLIGKYPSYDEAKAAQTAMKNSKARVAPLRRVDDIYALQIGAYSNMDSARAVAGTYSKEGYDVWIYQQ